MVSSKADKRIKTINGIGYRTVVTSYGTFILHVTMSRKLKTVQMRTRLSFKFTIIVFLAFFELSFEAN